jgi:hypothetical protein
MYVCNPINIPYKYQFHSTNDQQNLTICREAADPSLILFKGKYYMFPSMTAGFLASDNLVDWEFHPLRGLPVYDYAPDARVIGDYIYFSASNLSRNCSFYRTKDPINGDFEEIEGPFPFWDPHLFLDDDGRVYFYWGCSNITPIYGVEMDPESMTPKTEPIELIYSNMEHIGFERLGEDHQLKTQEELEEERKQFALAYPFLSDQTVQRVISNNPYIEGPWMNKHNGKYYLQYAAPATQNNIYADGVYVSDSPLGPFTLAKNNPYSYKPGGYMPGAGHGSTMEDRFGNLWHASTMRISVNQKFERRIGIWPAGFDEDGELFCNQRYGDWPMKIEQAQIDPWANPDWMLLSYQKPARASSFVAGKEPSKATDENVQTWWKAAVNAPGEWLEVDLQHACDVRAIQINFADDELQVPLPEGAKLEENRFIDLRPHVTRWHLEGSLDGETYFTIEDKSNSDKDLPHDLIVRESGIVTRFIRVTVIELPYKQTPCISGLRVFGIGSGNPPEVVCDVRTNYLSDLDLLVSWAEDDAVGHIVLWGHRADKLYHSYMVFGRSEVKIGALVKGQPLYVRVDAFNESGITEGEVFQVFGPEG